MTRDALEPTRSVFGASLGLAVALSFVLALRGQEDGRPLLAGLGLILIGGLLFQKRAPRYSPLLLVVAILNALVIVPELGLRIAGFRYFSGVQFGYPTPTDFQAFEPDDELFWRLPTDAPHVNSLGFLGPEPAVPKPTGVHRVLFLGDSCLQQGTPSPVPEMVPDLANGGRSPEEPLLEAVNLSMSGYSSHQGLRLAEQVGHELDPDVVVIYYGWNDHWRAYGSVDHEKSVDAERERLYRRSRLLQGLRRLVVVIGGSGAAPPLERNRVPIERYGENLTALATFFGDRDVPVVFVTAPSAHNYQGVPDYLVQRGFAPDPETVLREHAEYNDVARRTARETGAQLLDLAAEFAADEDAAARFVEDGIHFNQLGCWDTASRIASFLSAAGLDGIEESGR